MTNRMAQQIAEQKWSTDDDVAVGVVRWRRTHTPRFWVGVVFTDGRRPETKGESNVDWESAFAHADGAFR
jgi:hypothetical protein